MKIRKKRIAFLMAVLLVLVNLFGIGWGNTLLSVHAAAPPAAVNLTWDIVNASTKYEIFRDNVKVDTTISNSYNDTAAEENTSYVYAIKAYKDNELLAETTPIKVSTFDEPKTPTNVTASAVNATSLSVSWNPAENYTTDSAINLTWIPIKHNLALGKSYIKSEQPEAGYSDTNEMESTDGILAKDYVDGKSYGYQIPFATTKSVYVILDLESTTEINNVKVHKWEGSINYNADTIGIYVSQDGISYDFVGTPHNLDDVWFNLSFGLLDARYVKVEFTKKNTGEWGDDWLFLDEIEVYHNDDTPIANTSNDINLALGKSYTKSEASDISYPDSSESESTDGIIAKDYTDGYSYGYQIPNTATKSVDVTIDLGAVTNFNNIKVHKWEGSFYYNADTITVYASRDGVNYDTIGLLPTLTADIWHDLVFKAVNARFVKVSFEKYNDGSNGKDWLFIDEIQIYKILTIKKDKIRTYEIEEDGVVRDNGSATTYLSNNLPLNSQHTYRVREKVDGAVSDWSEPVTIQLKDTECPAAPSNVKATNITNKSITLVWDDAADNVGVVSYKIFQDGIEIATTTVPKYTDNNLTASTAYTYTVKAVDAENNLSSASDELNVTTSLGPVLPEPPGPAVPEPEKPKPEPQKPESPVPVVPEPNKPVTKEASKSVSTGPEKVAMPENTQTLIPVLTDELALGSVEHPALESTKTITVKQTESTKQAENIKEIAGEKSEENIGQIKSNSEKAALEKDDILGRKVEGNKIKQAPEKNTNSEEVKKKEIAGNAVSNLTSEKAAKDTTRKKAIYLLLILLCIGMGIVIYYKQKKSAQKKDK